MDALVWGLLAAALVAGEVATLALVLGMLGVACLAGLAVALAGAGAVAQLAAAGATGVVLLAAVRPVARRHLQVRPLLPSGSQRSLPGREAVVVRPVTDDDGQVRLDGELWRARPAFPGTTAGVGARVWIERVEGATLRVYPREP